jgi:hypothetical protein
MIAATTAVTARRTAKTAAERVSPANQTRPSGWAGGRRLGLRRLGVALLVLAVLVGTLLAAAVLVVVLIAVTVLVVAVLVVAVLVVAVLVVAVLVIALLAAAVLVVVLLVVAVLVVAWLVVAASVVALIAVALLVAAISVAATAADGSLRFALLRPDRLARSEMAPVGGLGRAVLTQPWWHGSGLRSIPRVALRYAHVGAEKPSDAGGARAAEPLSAPSAGKSGLVEARPSEGRRVVIVV